MPRNKIELFEGRSTGAPLGPFTNKRFIPQQPNGSSVAVAEKRPSSRLQAETPEFKRAKQQPPIPPPVPSKNFLNMDTCIASGGASYLRDPCAHLVLTDVNGDHEDPRDYRRGGYHPVRLGELFNRR